MTFLSNRISDYHFISQGKTRIPGVNDGEQFEITDVSDRVGAYNFMICLIEYIMRLGKFYEHN